MSRRTEQAARALPWLLATSLLVAAACGDDEPAPTPEPEPTNNSTPNNSQPPQRWTLGTIEAGGVGYQPDLAVSADGQVAVAYFTASGREDGPCPNLGDDAPIGVRWPIRYATFDGAAWAVETVAEPLFLGQPPGVSLAFAPDGTPTLSTLSGEPLMMQRYCGANDVGLYTRGADGTWGVETAVASSGQAATGMPGSDFGEVVGYWPGLAFDGQGNPAVVYKDVHSGSIQSDDLRRADLELAWRRGGWQAIPVNAGNGAGDFNQLLFDGDNPYVVYYTPWEKLEAPNLGVWVSRSLDAGATWETVQLFSQGTAQGPFGAFLPDGTLVVAFYNSSRGYPTLARLTDPTSFTSVSAGWELEDIGDSRYDEGYAPSVAISPDGYLGVAYYRCVRSVDELGNCSAAEDALIFAWLDGDTWTREVVDEGDEGICGATPTLGFDSAGRALIAYSCEVLVDGSLENQLRYAVRRALP